MLASGPPKNPSRVSNRPELGENVSILLENSEFQLDLSRHTSIPILKNSSHSAQAVEEQLSQSNEQRNIFFVNEIIIIFVSRLTKKPWINKPPDALLLKPYNVDIQVNSELHD